MGGTPYWSSEVNEEEGAAETTCDKLLATPILHPLAPLMGEGREIRSEVKPRKKGGVGKCNVLRFGFIFITLL